MTKEQTRKNAKAKGRIESIIDDLSCNQRIFFTPVPRSREGLWSNPGIRYWDCSFFDTSANYFLAPKKPSYEFTALHDFFYRIVEYEELKKQGARVDFGQSTESNPGYLNPLSFHIEERIAMTKDMTRRKVIFDGEGISFFQRFNPSWLYAGKNSGPEGRFTISPNFSKDGTATGRTYSSSDRITATLHIYCFPDRELLEKAVAESKRDIGVRMSVTDLHNRMLGKPI